MACGDVDVVVVLLGGVDRRVGVVRV